MSQSPQTGQFNSYEIWVPKEEANNMVSIPSNGSIQFLLGCWTCFSSRVNEGLNPLKRVNSILTLASRINWVVKVSSSLNPLKRVNSILTRRLLEDYLLLLENRSQSPQTGQFNSYLFWRSTRGKRFVSQSPQTGQFNSYGTAPEESLSYDDYSLNPLKRVNSILTENKMYFQEFLDSLNPLKRVNSILTENRLYWS